MVGRGGWSAAAGSAVGVGDGGAGVGVDGVVGERSDRDEVLAAAPQAEDGQFRVPPVLGDPS